MEVAVDQADGPRMHFVLKLYDRRFGTDLRSVLHKHIPHTATGEQLFQDFVRDGQILPFLTEYDHEAKTGSFSIEPADVYYPDSDDDDDDDGDGDGGNEATNIRRAKYEAALWYQCNEYYASETTAYERLAELQGKSIPQLHAHVGVRLREDPCNKKEKTTPAFSSLDRYLDIKGVLLQKITGYRLWDLPIVQNVAPQSQDAWPLIVQTAVDAVHEINKRGIILEDCGPRNVVVDQQTATPFVIDFA